MHAVVCIGWTVVVVILISLGLLGRIIFLFWFWPAVARRRLLRGGFSGPRPSFPRGNLTEMYCNRKVVVEGPLINARGAVDVISHDIHSAVFPYFATWTKIFGKVFVYWVGTEPFVYIAEPEFLKQVTTSGGMEKKWGKPNVFKHDRMPMFGNGLLMVEGDDWTHHRHIVARAFSTTNLNAMIGMMVESTAEMLDDWSSRMAAAEAGGREIDVEKDIIRNAAEIIAKTSFGIIQENGKKVFEKLQHMQTMLFKSDRLVGVPFSKILSPRQSYEAWKLGKEIDGLLLDIIRSRKENPGSAPAGGGDQKDLLGFLLEGMDGGEGGRRKLTSRELVEECKTFFFGGHETTALALTWTLLLLALYPQWQKALREEIMEVSAGQPLTPHMLSKLTKMGWVWNEVLRLYSPAPNVQRQAREEVVIGEVVIPKGTNMWVDVVGMHHDRALWGDDVNEFKPERFKDHINGGCKHRMGFIPFGFGGRICIGRNLTILEYKVVLSLILRKFVLSVSPAYIHSPKIMLTLRPSQGVPLMLHHL
ncbi:Cytochrome P450 714C2 [Platanthera zijinensis]|uniref:Cytochrome P450 714C2 n=1 Tax=Platanthera zijinensis TaxID=2320716 RepID=A0AAP0BP54_9ASPA